ncbi:alanyl-tRNA synthetase [Thermocatellispora tengchongensis]|uniref:Alanine--tRNA ligase n=1 Tax=Thermocatellispora tengchongensis TaxID=1073253 RepID=A0A840PL73_9ACTN|nr:alanine--tRNA ligase [Thermocatellispora tengchongensis]MBB5140258.1 alanyl-tRNA synthetase [Thermocatellispora tengchongensis]
MESAEIARRFLRFFEERGHTVVPSASLIAEDPTLLLVNAGMVPFKPYFLGQRKPPYPRATSAQKVIRTNDIDEVGKTTRHASFFQMLGNFSFGDYFKDQAIPYAWELLTKPESEGGFGFPEDRLWATVYHDDDEAADIWHKKVGVPLERIQRRGMVDNFWSMGVPGPCGPCTEIYYDRGPEYGRDGGPVADENRYLEVWNNVFMQFERGEGPVKEGYEILGELPAKSVDTGMGLERMAAILQGVDNIYEIDTTYKILDRAAELTRSRYGRDPRADVSLRVVADHMRAGVMLVGDGVLPSNEGRGYVLRRMLRRAIRNLRLLGAGDERYMHELTATTIEVMSAQYSELKADAANIHTVIDAEEASFLGTLRTGTAIFDVAVEEAKRKGQGVLPGAQAFQLHDTYGFPIDLTLEMAAEQGLQVDEEGFRRLMKEQRDRAKADAAAKKTGNADISVFGQILEKAGKVDFLGYDQTDAESEVIGILVEGGSVPAAGAGTTVEVVLARTPFYAEGGGQLADQGVIRTSGAEVEVVDVQQPVSGVIVHRGKVRSGELRVGDAAHAEIDVERRRAISRSHTATHLVHRGFRNALGESAAQAGSENSPGRFRFDFTAAGAVPPTVLRDVEDEVNAVLINDLRVNAFITSQAEARAMGALALFGEKYGDEVRIVEVGDYSRELCGGTHVASSGQLGLIKVMSESSIGAGVRRVDALVGLDAFRFLARESVLVSQLSEQLKARREELPERIEGIVTRLRSAEKELERLRSAQVLAVAGELATGARDVHGVSLVVHRVPDGTSADDLRKLALDVRGRFPADRPAVVVITGVPADRPVVVATANEPARDRGLKAGALVGVAAKALGGGGGGKDDIAQGGGTRPEAIPDALRAVEETVTRHLS